MVIFECVQIVTYYVTIITNEIVFLKFLTAEFNIWQKFTHFFIKTKNIKLGGEIDFLRELY